MASVPLFRPAVVADVQRPTAQIVRIRLEGPALAGLASSGAAEHFRLFFPAPGETMPAGTPGAWDLAARAPQPNSRSYTPLRIDAANGAIDFAVILHGSGIGAEWAAQVAPGDGVLMAGPSRPYTLDPATERHLLLGDAAALPALSTILEALPATARGEVFAETVTPQQRLILPAPAGVRIVWLTGNPAQPDAALEHVLDGVTPEPTTAIWIACEASVMRRLRRRLLDAGHPKQRLVTRGYWRQATPNHPDADYGEADLV